MELFQFRGIPRDPFLAINIGELRAHEIRGWAILLAKQEPVKVRFEAGRETLVPSAVADILLHDTDAVLNAEGSPVLTGPSFTRHESISCP